MYVETRVKIEIIVKVEIGFEVRISEVDSRAIAPLEFVIIITQGY